MDIVGTINLAPDEPYLEARELDRLIQLWLDDMAARVTPATAEGYAFKIQHFREWWAATGPAQQWRLYRRDLLHFGRYLQSKQCARTDDLLSYHTRNDVHRRLRQMFRWAHVEGYTAEMDYSLWVPTAEGEAVSRTAPSVDDLRRLFDAAAASSSPARDRALLAVFIGTGIRRSECASMRVETIEFYADGSGTAKVVGKRTRSNSTGKREVAFDATTGNYLLLHLDSSGLERGPVWKGARGVLTPQGIYKIVKKCIWEANIEHKIQGCHDLRRAFATHYARRFQSPVHADLLRRQMGHASYRMTSQYSLLDANDIRANLESPMVDVVQKPTG